MRTFQTILIGVVAGVVLLGAGTGVAWWELRERTAQPLAASVAAAPIDAQAESRRRVSGVELKSALIRLERFRCLVGSLSQPAAFESGSRFLGR